MSAYWIATYLEISDPDKMAAYAALAAPAIEAGGGEYLVRASAEHAYEAGRLERSVVIRFGSVEAAVATHDSDDYQAALAVLDGGATRDLRIVPGV